MRGTRLGALLAGLVFVRRTPVLLGAISLDLVAVLFGGAVALLPLFARDILEVGPVGLGILRSAPAVGALVAGIMLTRRPLGEMAGRTLLIVVSVFGGSMIVFGLSHSFALSFAALAVGGFSDMISMNIRATITALATPDALRGRVNAVEMVFISASNELGAFESGAAAALVGAVPAVVVGGWLTILCALVWPRLFPTWRASTAWSRCTWRTPESGLRCHAKYVTIAATIGEVAAAAAGDRCHSCSWLARSSSLGQQVAGARRARGRRSDLAPFPGRPVLRGRLRLSAA